MGSFEASHLPASGKLQIWVKRLPAPVGAFMSRRGAAAVGAAAVTQRGAKGSTRGTSCTVPTAPQRGAGAGAASGRSPAALRAG